MTSNEGFGLIDVARTVAEKKKVVLREIDPEKLLECSMNPMRRSIVAELAKRGYIDEKGMYEEEKRGEFYVPEVSDFLSSVRISGRDLYKETKEEALIGNTDNLSLVYLGVMPLSPFYTRLAEVLVLDDLVNRVVIDVGPPWIFTKVRVFQKRLNTALKKLGEDMDHHVHSRFQEINLNTIKYPYSERSVQILANFLDRVVG